MLASSELQDATARKIVRNFFIADVMVLSISGFAQGMGFKEIKLKEADMKKLQWSLSNLSRLLNRENEIIKLMETRYQR